MIKRILVALGGTPFSHVAVKRGIELAQVRGAKVIAVPLLDQEYWKSTFRPLMSASEGAKLLESRPWAVAERRLTRVVTELRRDCEAADVTLEVAQSGEKPFEVFASESRYCDLVVFGLRGLFDYNLVPEPEATIAQLIRRGVRPILAVASKYRPIRRVLIAYSGSMESARTMRQFVQMRLWPEAELRIVHFGENRDKARELLGRAGAYCEEHGFEPTAEVVEQSARSALLPYAEEVSADLLVLGDSFRHVLLRDLLGDTMSHVVRSAGRPIFLSH